MNANNGCTYDQVKDLIDEINEHSDRINNKAMGILEGGIRDLIQEHQNEEEIAEPLTEIVDDISQKLTPKEKWNNFCKWIKEKMKAAAPNVLNFLREVLIAVLAEVTARQITPGRN